MLNDSSHRAAAGSSDRAFGLVFVVFFAIIGCWPLFSGGSLRMWALIASAVLFVLALAWPSSLAGLNRIWMRFGLLLGSIISPIALGIVFFLTVLPMGLIMRLLGKDPLRVKYDRSSRSYWITREPPGPDPKTMDQQF